MTRSTALLACMGVLCLSVAPHAAAEPVTITSGSIVLSEATLSQTGSISIFGTRGFSILGRVDSGEGNVDPLRQCFPCEPRQDFSVGASLGTFAIVGDATLDGKTYPNINRLDSLALALLHLAGVTQLPPVQESSIVITAPFTVAEHSFFRFPVTPDSVPEFPELATVPLRGGGTATLAFTANPTVPVWEFSHLRYDFQPVPEPATLVLVGGSLVGALLGRGMRRSRHVSGGSALAQVTHRAHEQVRQSREAH